LAEAVRRRGAVLAHLSTDYVFGQGQGPWREDSRCEPLNVYGQSKRAGELAILACDPSAFIIRTAWLFDGVSANFLTAMLALTDREGLDVTDDQIGSPTFTDDLADGLIALLGQRERLESEGGGGVLHFVNAGEGATRLQMAQAVFEAVSGPGAVTPRLHPVSQRDWPSAAVRPLDSRLSMARWSKLGLPTPRHWRDAVVAAVQQAQGVKEGAR
jgi:dTDP-4-dehydrorhamnose reductase